MNHISAPESQQSTISIDLLSSSIINLNNKKNEDIQKTPPPSSPKVSNQREGLLHSSPLIDNNHVSNIIWPRSIRREISHLSPAVMLQDSPLFTSPFHRPQITSGSPRLLGSRQELSETLNRIPRYKIMLIYSMLTYTWLSFSLCHFSSIQTWLQYDSTLFALWHAEFHTCYLLFEVVNTFFWGDLAAGNALAEKRRAWKSFLTYLLNGLTLVAIWCGSDFKAGFYWLLWLTPLAFLTMCLTILQSRLNHPVYIVPTAPQRPPVAPSRRQSRLSSILDPSISNTQNKNRRKRIRSDVPTDLRRSIRRNLHNRSNSNKERFHNFDDFSLNHHSSSSATGDNSGNNNNNNSSRHEDVSLVTKCLTRSQFTFFATRLSSILNVVRRVRSERLNIWFARIQLFHLAIGSAFALFSVPNILVVVCSCWNTNKKRDHQVFSWNMLIMFESLIFFLRWTTLGVKVYSTSPNLKSFPVPSSVSSSSSSDDLAANQLVSIPSLELFCEFSKECAVTIYCSLMLCMAAMTAPLAWIDIALCLRLKNAFLGIVAIAKRLKGYLQLNSFVADYFPDVISGSCLEGISKENENINNNNNCENKSKYIISSDRQNNKLIPDFSSPTFQKAVSFLLSSVRYTQFNKFVLKVSQVFSSIADIAGHVLIYLLSDNCENIITPQPDLSKNDRHDEFEKQRGAVIENDVCCTICRETINHGKLLPCGHMLHTLCLRLWFEHETTCPICRKNCFSANASVIFRGARDAALGNLNFVGSPTALVTPQIFTARVYSPPEQQVEQRNFQTTADRYPVRHHPVCIVPGRVTSDPLSNNSAD